MIYDSYAGRWYTLDPLGIVPNAMTPNYYKPADQYKDGVNVYQYCKSNPIIYEDLYGLWPSWWPGWLTPKNPKKAYDWWDPSSTGCLKPCRWRNKGDAWHNYYEGGCVSTSGSLPIGPGAGPLLIIAGVIFELTSPSAEHCFGSLLEEGQKCQCRLIVRRRCKSKCCDKKHGVWTKTKKISEGYSTYGKVVNYGGLMCDCRPSWWMESPADLIAKRNKALDCDREN